jgi:pyrroloquinoline quinone (PQQ) biosynthesis protein C
MRIDLITRLRDEAAATIAAVDASRCIGACLDGTAELAQYASFLRETYHYVRWSHGTLAEAGRRMLALGRHETLGRLLSEKSGEEYGHEAWALADLEALGFDPAEIAGSIPSAATEAYVAWVRFLARSPYPSAYLGTAYVLESLSVARAGRAAAALVAAARIPNIDRAVTYLLGHADADGGHVETLEALLAPVEDEAEIDAIATSARTTRFLYAGILAAIDEAAPVREYA